MLRFLRGWIRIQITGGVPERFFNLCRNRGILLWNLEVLEDGYACSLYRNEEADCQALLCKAGVTIAARQEYGIRIWIRRYQHRQAFIGTCCFLIFAVWFSSHYVWKIQIMDNLYYSDDQILSCLKEAGIQAGIWKQKIDCEQTEQLLRDSFERISWSAASLDGTVLRIAVAENYGTLEAVMAETTPADLIAAEDGVVASIIVRKGVAQVGPGDLVQKGQILISGKVLRRNDADEVTGYESVHAEGTVFLKTELLYEDFCECEMIKKIAQAGKGSVYTFCVGGKQWKFATPVRSFWNLKGRFEQGKEGRKNVSEGIQTSGSEKQAELEQTSDSKRSVKMPQKIGMEIVGTGYRMLEVPAIGFSCYAYREEQRTYSIQHVWMSETEVKEKLQEKLNTFLQELKKNENMVVENQVRIYYDSVGYRAKGKIVVLKPQAGYEPINESEQEMETRIENESD